MATGREIFVEDRIIQVLKHLKIERAHFASSGLPDWRGLAANYPEAILSLALVCPWGFDPVAAKALSSRLLVIKGDKGPMAEQAENALKKGRRRQKEVNILVQLRLYLFSCRMP